MIFALDRPPDLTITVPGKAQPAGSKRFVTLRNGRGIVLDANKRAKDWKALVSLTASERTRVYGGGWPYHCPVAVRVTFHIQRPQGHSGKRGIKPSAPPFHLQRPDLTKLWRGTEDAMTGIIYADDSQIVFQNISKEWADRHETVIELWLGHLAITV